MIEEKINAKITLKGEPASIYRELRGRGVVLSVRDAFSKGLYKLYDEVLEREMKKTKLAAIKRLEENMDV
jgi:hypothetical protein